MAKLGTLVLGLIAGGAYLFLTNAGGFAEAFTEIAMKVLGF